MINIKKDNEDDTNKSKPIKYYITGIIPFKEYFLFSKAKEVTIKRATNSFPVIMRNISFIIDFHI